MTARPGFTTRDGYAFPMALAAIVIITLIVGMAASQVERAIETYTRQTEAFDRNVEARSAEQTFLYHALTSPMGDHGVEIGGISAIDRLFASTNTPAGDDVIVLLGNGEPRAYGNGLVIRYIDQQSFFNMSALGAVSGNNRMTALGVPQVRWTSLRAALQDYQDDNTVRSPGGAEAPYYDRPGLPPNRPLLSPLEICRVRGWTEESLCRDPDHLLLRAMPRGTAQLNPHLASIPFLLDLTGSRAGAERAQAAFEDRTYNLFANVGQAELDNSGDLLDVPTQATGRFALVVQDRSAQSAWLSVYELTPQNLRAPFSLAYRYRIGGPYVRDALGISPDEPIQPLPEAGR